MLEAESILVQQGNVCPDCRVQFPLSYNFCTLCGLPLPAMCFMPDDAPEFSNTEISEAQRQDKIAALQDYLQNEPVATYRGKVSGQRRPLTSLLVNGGMPESLPVRQATMTNQGKKPSACNVNKRRVPTAYCLDQIRDHFGDRFDTVNDLAETIEQVGQAQRRLKELRGY